MVGFEIGFDAMGVVDLSHGRKSVSEGNRRVLVKVRIMMGGVPYWR